MRALAEPLIGHGGYALANATAVEASAHRCPSPQYLIKVEEHSAASQLVPLQCHMLVKEQLARKPESGSARPSAPNTLVLQSPRAQGGLDPCGAEALEAEEFAYRHPASPHGLGQGVAASTPERAFKAGCHCPECPPPPPCHSLPRSSLSPRPSPRGTY